MNRCLWCNQQGPDVREIVVTTVDRFGRSPHERTVAVHPEHEREFREFNDRVRRFGGLFLILVGACLLAALVLEFVLLRVNAAFGIIGIGLAVALLGGIIALFPFATPETVAAFGGRASKRLARGAGAAMIVAGLIVAAIPAL
jgi:hypothetical protein